MSGRYGLNEVRGHLEVRGGGLVIIWTLRNEEEATAVTHR